MPSCLAVPAASKVKPGKKCLVKISKLNDVTKNINSIQASYICRLTDRYAHQSVPRGGEYQDDAALHVFISLVAVAQARQRAATIHHPVFYANRKEVRKRGSGGGWGEALVNSHVSITTPAPPLPPSSLNTHFSFLSSIHPKHFFFTSTVPSFTFPTPFAHHSFPLTLQSYTLSTLPTSLPYSSCITNTFF